MPYNPIIMEPGVGHHYISLLKKTNLQASLSRKQSGKEVKMMASEVTQTRVQLLALHLLFE